MLMTDKRLNQIEQEIERIKTKLMKLKIFRPGSITEQYKNPKKKTGGYYQLNYMHRMESKSEYVRPGLIKALEKQTADYKKFKKLIERWIALGIEHSRTAIKLKNKKKT